MARSPEQWICQAQSRWDLGRQKEIVVSNFSSSVNSLSYLGHCVLECCGTPAESWRSLGKKWDCSRMRFTCRMRLQRTHPDSGTRGAVELTNKSRSLIEGQASMTNEDIVHDLHGNFGKLRNSPSTEPMRRQQLRIREGSAVVRYDGSQRPSHCLLDAGKGRGVT